MGASAKHIRTVLVGSCEETRVAQRQVWKSCALKSLALKGCSSESSVEVSKKGKIYGDMVRGVE